MDEAATPQIKFSFAFTYMTLADPTGSGEPIWFVVDSKIIDKRAKFRGGELACLDELGKTLKSQFEPAVIHQPKRITKSVRRRFHTPVQAPSPSPSLTMAADAFLSENCK